MVYLIIYIVVIFIAYFILEYMYYAMNNPLNFDKEIASGVNIFFASAWILVLLVLIVSAPFALIHFLVEKLIGKNN